MHIYPYTISSTHITEQGELQGGRRYQVFQLKSYLCAHVRGQDPALPKNHFDRTSTPPHFILLLPMHQQSATKGKRQRTFTGCRTCRRRRVKCDEQKPTCGHCERLKLECEGYDALLQWLRPVESSRFLEIDEDESSIALEDQRQSRRQLYSG
jgi:hypothetical protein